jgi:predicted nucleotidyltransferase
MLKIFNTLEPFFEDCYRRYSVREYATLIKVSPPTASSILKNFTSQDLLNEKKERVYKFYWVKRDSNFIDLSRIYWKNKFMRLGILKYIENEVIDPLIILFGSLSKAEVTESSDIDFAMICSNKKNLDLKKFEKKLGRNIHLLVFKSLDEIPKELKSNILNGFVLRGNF